MPSLPPAPPPGGRPPAPPPARRSIPLAPAGGAAAPGRKRLGELLKDAGLIDDRGLRLALSEQARWGGPLGKMLVDLHLVREPDLVAVLSRQLNVPGVTLAGYRVPPANFKLVPIDVCQRFQLLPLADDGVSLQLAMGDPTNEGALEELRLRTRRILHIHLAGPREIADTIDAYVKELSPSGEWRVDPGLPSVRATPERDARVSSTARKDLSPPAPPPALSPLTPLTPQHAEQALDLSAIGDTLRQAIGTATDSHRTQELAALQQRVVKLEGLLTRDEDIIRRLCGLLVRKKLCTREEIMEALK